MQEKDGGVTRDGHYSQGRPSRTRYDHGTLARRIARLLTRQPSSTDDMGLISDNGSQARIRDAGAEAEAADDDRGRPKCVHYSLDGETARGGSDLVAATGPNGRCPGLSWSMLAAPAGLASCNGYFHPSNGARMARRKHAQFAPIPTRTLLLSSGSLRVASGRLRFALKGRRKASGSIALAWTLRGRATTSHGRQLVFVKLCHPPRGA